MKRSMRAMTLAVPMFMCGLAAQEVRAQENTGALPSVGPVMPATSMDRSLRPAAKSVAIGLGVVVGSGAEIWQPSIATVRFMLSDSLTLEPSVILSHQNTTSDPAGPGPNASTSQTTLNLGTLARFLLASRGPVDLSFLAGGSIGYTSVDKTADAKTTSVDLSWGLGLSWFFNQWWALSLDALNPVFQLSNTATEAGLGDNVVTDWEVGAIFNPVVRMLLHMYF